MSVKLHRCPVMWPKTDKHPCYHVQMALDEAGVDPAAVTGTGIGGRITRTDAEEYIRTHGASAA